ncbi:MAG: enoyl-CoA hydratase-related protein [Bryobacteraceae bacterium]
MSETPILYSAADSIARITLNRPDKRNALNAEVVAGLADGLRRADADASVKVILLTGAGKDFCSGADLANLQKVAQNGVIENMNDARAMANVFLAIRKHRCPVVAAVRGRALAGGCGLATACDLILASHTAQFGYPEVNIGFIPAMVMAILRRNVSEKQAFEMITMGDPMPASQAYFAGLVNQVWSDGEFEQRVEEYVAKLASKSASAVQLSKNLLYHMDGMTFETALESGVHANGIARQTEDCKAGIAKFLNKS